MTDNMSEAPLNTRLTLDQIMLLVFEGLVLFGITIAFWYPIDPSQGLREVWFWMLWLAVPIFALRLKVFGYFWTHLRLHDLVIIFIILAAFSYTNALHQRESFLAPMARPLLGIWTFVYFVEVTRASKSLKTIIILMLGMSFCMGTLALTASQWQEEKMGVLWNVVDVLPRFNYRVTAVWIDNPICSPLVKVIHTRSCFNPSDMLNNSFLSFNVNEIAGALAWVTPMMAAFALMIPKRDDEVDDIRSKPFWMIIRLIAAIIFVIMFIALFFGQSRFAITGVLITLILLTFTSITKPLWRYFALGFIAFMIVLQAGLLFNVFAPPNVVEQAPRVGVVVTPVVSITQVAPIVNLTQTAPIDSVPQATSDDDTASTGLSIRDFNSVSGRFAIWEQSIRMMMNNPANGVGMYMFRTAISQDPYRIPYEAPPHAHNEWLNVGAEMGLAGFILYIALQINVLWMLWQGWTQGNQVIRMVALATFVGLLAHAAYGLGDAIALWDRFHFVLWWLVGLAGAQYVLLRLHTRQDLSDAAVDIID